MRKCFLLLLLAAIVVSCEKKQEEPQHQPSSPYWSNLAGKKYCCDCIIYDNIRIQHDATRYLDFVSTDSVFRYTVLDNNDTVFSDEFIGHHKCCHYKVQYPFMTIYTSGYDKTPYKFIDTLTIYYDDGGIDTYWKMLQ